MAGERVLVVDDSRVFQDLVVNHVLEPHGYQALSALDGDSGLSIALEEQLDLIIMDMEMPGMTGIQVLEALCEAGRDIPVILMTLHGSEDLVVRAFRMGVKDYVIKPFAVEEMLAAMDRALTEMRLRRERDALFVELMETNQQLEEEHCQLEAEKKRSDDLLHVIFPPEIVQELKETDSVKSRYYQDVAILFADIVDFTAYCDTHAPDEVVSSLQAWVEAYESIALWYDLQKIKTTGDEFMGVAGLLKPVDNPVLNCVKCAQEMLSITHQLPAKWDVRIGIHVGPVIAGVVGHRQYLFDVWGDAVNTTHRIQSIGDAHTISLSAIAWQKIAGQCEGESLGSIPIKGKGELEIVRVQSELIKPGRQVAV